MVSLNIDVTLVDLYDITDRSCGNIFAICTKQNCEISSEFVLIATSLVTVLKKFQNKNNIIPVPLE